MKQFIFALLAVTAVTSAQANEKEKHLLGCDSYQTNTSRDGMYSEYPAHTIIVYERHGFKLAKVDGHTMKVTEYTQTAKELDISFSGDLGEVTLRMSPTATKQELSYHGLTYWQVGATLTVDGKGFPMNCSSGGLEDLK